MQLPGQNLPLQQERVTENLPAARSSARCPSPLGSTTASAQSLKSVHPYFCSLHTGYSLHFHNSQSTNESSRADWLRKSKITISTDFSWTESLLIWGTDHQVGAASTNGVWCSLGLKALIRQAMMWLKHLEDDETAKKPGIQTEITDFTWS